VIHEYAILFTYHGGAHPGALAQNLERLRRYNPGVPIIPLIHDGAPTIEGSVDVSGTPCPWDTDDKWRSCDTMIYRWFPLRSLQAERYVLCEWDTYSTTSIRAFYAPVWDADVAAVEAFTPDERPDWWFFREIPLLGAFAPQAGALVPLSGTLLSAAALEAICSGPILPAPFCELRMGTLARHAGLKLTPMPFAKPFISWNAQEILVSEAPAIYHPVKEVVPAAPRPLSARGPTPIRMARRRSPFR
jgi:hypothetical protein